MNDAELVEEMLGLSGEEATMIRQRAENDLYFLAKAFLGMKDVDYTLHKPFCNFIEDESLIRKMALMPRGTLKSSLSTVANNIRRPLKNPEVRIMIGNEVYDNSSAFLDEIQGHFENNPLIKHFWPHVVPERFSGAGVSWSGKGATVQRKGIYKEPTWFPIGVGGAATSKHFTHIDNDDLIGLKAFESPAEMLSAIRWNRNIEPLVTDAFTSVITWLGTRWLGNDLYGDVEEMYGPSLAIYHQGIYTAEGEVVFPKKISKEFLERIARNEPDRFAAQYLNDPQSSKVLDFDYKLVKSFTFTTQHRCAWMETGEEYESDIASMDRVMSIDPNGGKKTAKDEFAISVAGNDANGEIFSLESWGGRPNPDEAADKVVELFKKWRPRVIGVEEAAQQTTQFMLEKRFKEEGLHVTFIPLKPGNIVKEERIRNILQPLIATGVLHVPLTQTDLRSQVRNFPGTKLDDRIDALAYAITLLRLPISQAKLKKARTIVRKLLRMRNPVTGY